MLDDLTKEIKAQLYERVKSPLFGAFALSWLAWNYRPILAVLSGMPFDEKLKYLDSLYPSASHWAGYGFGGPLLTAVLFLLAYPYPARWMYRYWANQHKKLKKVQQEIEDETPLTQEEANALRKVGQAQAVELEAEIAKQRQLVRELNERLRVAAEETLRVMGERDQFADAAKKASEELAGHLAGVLHDDPPKVTAGEALSAAAKLMRQDPQKFMSYLPKEDSSNTRIPSKESSLLGAIEDGPVTAPSEQEENGKLRGSGDAFRALCRLDGATTKELATILGWDVGSTQEALLKLVRDGKAIRSEGLWALSELGKHAKSAQFGILEA